MRSLLAPTLALVLIGADQPSAPASAPVPTIRTIEPSAPSDKECRERITRVREKEGKPPLLDRSPASPERPYRLYAVEKRIDGCAVMVMHGDITDIRPLPARPEGSAVILPLDKPR